MKGIYLGLGSNLGNRQANIELALRMLAPLARVEAVSPLYETPPQPPAPPPPYLNAAARIVTGLSPMLLLRHLKRIEDLLGRRSGEVWGPRPIDMDIVLYETQVLAEPELTVPHARLRERAFVLQPLLDLDPDLVDPVTREPLAELLPRVGSDGISLYAPAGWNRTLTAGRL